MGGGEPVDFGDGPLGDGFAVIDDRERGAHGQQFGRDVLQLQKSGVPWPGFPWSVPVKNNRNESVRKNRSTPGVSGRLLKAEPVNVEVLDVSTGHVQCQANVRFRLDRPPRLLIKLCEARRAGNPPRQHHRRIEHHI